jgi:hypothetical protein
LIVAAQRLRLINKMRRLLRQEGILEAFLGTRARFGHVTQVSGKRMTTGPVELTHLIKINASKLHW